MYISVFDNQILSTNNMNPSCLPSHREINESLRKQLSLLQKTFEEEKRTRVELESKLLSNESRHQTEIENCKNRQKCLGRFSNSFELLLFNRLNK